MHVQGGGEGQLRRSACSSALAAPGAGAVSRLWPRLPARRFVPLAPLLCRAGKEGERRGKARGKHKGGTEGEGWREGLCLQQR